MAQFTQLGLSGKPEGKAAQNISNPRERKSSGKRTSAALAGASLAAAVLTAFLLTSGCSKGSSSKPAATSNQAPQATPVAAAPAAPSPPPAAATQPPEVKKPVHRASRQHKLSAYTNPAYGVSFRYPKHYNLKEGDEANLQWDGLGPVEMNFVQPGGSTLTAVELPGSMYAGTDFTSAFFNVSVNPKLTSAQCEQFAWPETGGPDAEPLIPSKAKVGATEFNEIQAYAEAQTRQADAKYYHVFQNGMCYEFAVGLETTSEDSGDGLKAVDRDQVFRKLNWILSTVKIQPVDVPEVAHATSVSGDSNSQ
ncbi:MAG: hypothetical protein LAN63_13340 [Acidobacteriia bacterium]|nr:hypothetical protein [Terriglobia bacterium]